MQAFCVVKANAGSAGLDQQSVAEYEINLQKNLYKLWNRMSSGTYFPTAVKRVAIPKKAGGERILGIPTITDRIAQTAVKLLLEEELEPRFCSDSYGYRPHRSAIDAITVTKERCRSYAFVLEFDIKSLFDTIPWDKLLKAVRHHTENKWVILYIERFLQAPLEDETGERYERTSGTPQGGPVSPLLANLFMHYTFDVWMNRRHPKNPWCRYADDGIIHCRTEQEAKSIRSELEMRLQECGLEIHPQKTRIVYCQNERRRLRYANRQFDFLGYTFRARAVQNRQERRLFMAFSPGASASAQKEMRRRIRVSNIRNRSDLSIEEIARKYNPMLRGWFNYYGQCHPRELSSVFRHFNRALVGWAMRRYKKLARGKTRASRYISKICRAKPGLFSHWRFYYGRSFA